MTISINCIIFTLPFAILYTSNVLLIVAIHKKAELLLKHINSKLTFVVYGHVCLGWMCKIWFNDTDRSKKKCRKWWKKINEVREIHVGRRLTRTIVCFVIQLVLANGLYDISGVARQFSYSLSAPSENHSEKKKQKKNIVIHNKAVETDWWNCVLFAQKKTVYIQYSHTDTSVVEFII